MAITLAPVALASCSAKRDKCRRHPRCKARQAVTPVQVNEAASAGVSVSGAFMNADAGTFASSRA